MKLSIARIDAIASNIAEVELRGMAGEELPAFEAGAHLPLTLPGGFQRRYSLTSDPHERHRYTIAVLGSEGGRGSSWFHREARAGDLVEAEPPRNGFELGTARHTILIAGGIGITPILSHTRELERRGASFAVHYAVRKRDSLAFRGVLPGAVTEYVSEEGTRIDVASLLTIPDADTQVYVCGPDRLLRAVRKEAARAGWSAEQIHFETFGAAWEEGDGPVQLELSLSRLELTVPAGQTLLEAMEQAGVWVPFDCRRGECHMCTAHVVSGEPVHRDHCLSPAERASFLTPCVSWARGRLVLEL